jgi:hypothetical protein
LSRRTLAGLCTAGLAAGIFTAPPASAKEKSDQDLVTTFQTILGGGLVGFDTRTGKTLELSPLEVINNLVDASTNKVIGRGSAQFAISDGPADAPRSCIKSGNRHGLTAFSPINRTLVGNEGVLSYQYHPYRLENARRVGPGLSTQWEVCAKGGGQFAGARLRQVGTGMALNNSADPRRIGYAWQTGKTPKDYSLELGFQVEKGPVSVGASMSQQPVDKLLGGFRAPMRYDGLDSHQLDAVNAWWQDDCIGSMWRCSWRKGGSHDFQGTISHGLWEYPLGKEPGIVSFYLIPYASF